MQTTTTVKPKVNPFKKAVTYVKGHFRNKGVKARVKKSNSNSKVRAKVKKIDAKTEVLAAKERRFMQKQKTYQQKQAAIKARNDMNAERGGLRGYLARRRQTKIAEGIADVETAKLKPSLYEKSARTKIQTDAAVKQTKAKGAALATAVSALGGSIATKSVADSEASQAKSKAEEAAAKAIESSLNTVPQVTTDEYSNSSVSGLVTGVR